MNIGEIAKMAGVSSAAVSRYFNHGYISQEKKEAIRKVVEETGYRPSLHAQTLRTKKTRMIGVIVPKIASASIGKVIEGILSVLNNSEYQCLMAVTQNSSQKELEYLETFSERRVDGVILVATVLTREHKKVLKESKIPVVLVGQQLSGQFCVYHDDYHASYELASAVFQKGKKNLGYISAILEDKAVGAGRYRGFCDAVRDAGYDSLTKQYVISDFTLEGGYRKAGQLLERYPDLDGILCATDTMALGVIRYLKEQGGDALSRILVGGHGDSEMAKTAAAPLMTVHYFYEKSGELAVKMMLDILEGKDPAVKEMKLGFSLVDQE
ncbi:MAG TPA: LacI family DNA-binding transcriptional regulator [Candidatus Blautia excrementipullorum]|nr:LacI family DNA-binding transcriptional regulator [Candidatus Blautia excrementipullorum]